MGCKLLFVSLSAGISKERKEIFMQIADAYRTEEETITKGVQRFLDVTQLGIRLGISAEDFQCAYNLVSTSPSARESLPLTSHVITHMPHHQRYFSLPALLVQVNSRAYEHTSGQSGTTYIPVGIDFLNHGQTACSMLM